VTNRNKNLPIGGCATPSLALQEVF